MPPEIYYIQNLHKYIYHVHAPFLESIKQNVNISYAHFSLYRLIVSKIFHNLLRPQKRFDGLSPSSLYDIFNLRFSWHKNAANPSHL